MRTLVICLMTLALSCTMVLMAFSFGAAIGDGLHSSTAQHVSTAIFLVVALGASIFVFFFLKGDD